MRTEACPRGADRIAQRDTTVATQSVTALDDSAHGNMDETMQMSVLSF